MHNMILTVNNISVILIFRCYEKVNIGDSCFGHGGSGGFV